MTIYTTWIALALLGGPADPSPKVLVERLASPMPAVVGEAADALESLGFHALPALREGVTERGGESRRRMEELISRIGMNRLLRATEVKVEAEGLAVDAAVARLREAGGFNLALDPEKDARWAGRKVTVRADSPMGFFEALDRLGQSGGFRHDPTPSFTFPPPKGVRVRLVPFDGPTPPTAYAGPYRITLLGLGRRREVVQTRPPDEAKVIELFTLDLEVVAEPGILIDRNGAIRLREAVDDRGRDLRPESTADAVASQNPFSLRMWSQEQISTFRYQLPLKLPEGRGSRIVRLRGFVPITAIARTDELFSAPLAGVQNRTLTGGGVSMRVNQVGPIGPSMFLEVTIQGEPPPDPQAFAAGPRQITQSEIKLAYNLDDHLRIEDQDGNPFGMNAIGTSPPKPDGTMNFRVNLFSSRASKGPATIRYFGVAAVATEIPFEFSDLPIP